MTTSTRYYEAINSKKPKNWPSPEIMNPERSVPHRGLRAGGCPVVPVAEKKPETLKLISIMGVLSFGQPQEVPLNK